MTGAPLVTDLGPFLGRFHPLWIHLPIGIMILLWALELTGLVSRAKRFSWLPAISIRQRTLILALASVSAVVSAALGWFLGHSGDYDPAQLDHHQTMGLAAAATTVLVLAVHRLRWVYPPALIASLVLLGVAAHAGGVITHGSGYLTDHLPPALRKVMGIKPPVAPKSTRPPTFEQAVAYTDVIHPILEQRCNSCHGPTKSNGGLRMDTWELLAKGGKNGTILKPGDVAASELTKRINLPPDLKEHMPPKGKPQLTDEDLAILEWWVAAGTPKEARVAALEQPPAVAEILQSRLGGAVVEPPPDRTATLAQATQIAADIGVIIRPLTLNGPWLDVNARQAGKGFDDRQLARLAPIAPAVQWLDLGTTSVTDAGLANLASMRQLRRLHLDQTAITDVGLARLTSAKQLEYLNLRSTRVTDHGIGTLATLPHLRALYVWQTAVTPAALTALENSMVDKRKIARWKAQKAEIERSIQAEMFTASTGESLRPVAPPPPISPPPPAAPSK